MRQSAEIVQFQKKQDAKFICSACGADRGCDCNAPAVEKYEQAKATSRKSSAAYRDRKRQQKQRIGDVTDDEMPTEEEAEKSWQDDLYDQACLLLERMADATRQRLFAHIRRTYRHED